MGISVFPAPTTGSSASAFAATLENVGRVYEHAGNFPAGVYTVSVNPNTTQVKATFATNSVVVTSVVTTSGSVSFNLTTPATKVFLMSVSGGSTNAVVNIQKTADPLTSDDIGNGTLDTITTTGTYNQTGVLGVLVLGGGEQGGSTNGTGNNTPGQSGGRAGFINGDIVITNTPTIVTIGAGGIASTNAPVDPTNSSFGNFVTTNAASPAFPNGNGGSGAYSSPSAGNASGTFPSFNGNFTTGGGGGASARSVGEGRPGGGSGIGTGGSSNANHTSSGNSGTGRASGGGGGRANDSSADGRKGGDGTAGVVYVLRGF